MGQPPGSGLARTGVVLGGVAFVGSLLYFVYAYAGPFGRPAPASASAARATVINVLLFSAFTLHHSAFARGAAKRAIASLVSPAYERSVYVWASSALFFVVCRLWQPVPGALWTAPPAIQPLFLGVQLVGAFLAVRSAGRLDVLDLAGFRQALGPATASAPQLMRTGPYAFVRHPVYLGWLLLVWATPVMTGTRLVLAAVSTAYLVLAVPFEERDLRRLFGESYAGYARDVRWRIVPFVY